MSLEIQSASNSVRSTTLHRPGVERSANLAAARTGSVAQPTPPPAMKSTLSLDSLFGSGAVGPERPGHKASEPTTGTGGFFGRIGDFLGKLPGPFRDLLGDGLKKLGGKIGDFLLGGKDSAKRNDSVSLANGAVGSASGAGKPHCGAPPVDAAATESFEAMLSSILAPNDQGLVHEEELFAAVLKERVATLAGPEAAAAYEAALSEKLGALTRPDGTVPAEQAAIEALRQIRDQGVITAELGDRIYSEAFAAAQLDDNAEALFDDRGSETDATIATEAFDTAIQSAKSRVAAFDNGEATAPQRSLEEAAPIGASGTRSDEVANPSGAAGTPGTNDAASRSTATERKGFLWKPESDKDGKLVVLLPSEISNDARRVVVRDANGDVVARGQPTGIGNGDRAHFRFDRKGGSFVGPVTVEATLRDGSTRAFRVKDPSRRIERGAA